MPRPYVTILAVVAVAGAVAAGNFLRGRPAAVVPGSSAVAGRRPVPASDQKLEAAIECINKVSSQVSRAARNYREGVDPAAGPSAATRPNVYVGRVDVSLCLPGLRTALAATPAVPELDGAAATYAERVEALAPLVNDATDYYEQKRHLDDGAARGKELHPRLVDGFAGFAAADQSLRKVVDVRSPPIRRTR